MKSVKQIDYVQFDPTHFDGVLELGNRVHGDNYLTTESIKTIYEDSWQDDINASWVALLEGKVVGFRLTYAASKWIPSEWCSPELWPFPPHQVCYFKCNTVDKSIRAHGVGSKLLKRSIERAKLQGAKAGLAHIWLASPGNSAFKYFSKNGGKLVKKHPNRWRYASIHEGYDCPVCEGYCECVAAEMILPFK
ncbi:GNAT family N-acetyltransferase [Alteromonas ponticola]|uniref:GNAT family N-acetyltransferase n=1 Tax=Alteromonas aquimaris TaxID=2998417 RepID=A0ABT3P4T0_9ALTE|nr:GNAT family N-acetyltransferase [Alteromonas aquimaris]MCW8107505.1 GNAT family N-acetyltransferase [Alteromonas aquimaris]